jgi:hypothetical protein
MIPESTFSYNSKPIQTAVQNLLATCHIGYYQIIINAILLRVSGF